jgi:hypothetical protein
MKCCNVLEPHLGLATCSTGCDSELEIKANLIIPDCFRYYPAYFIVMKSYAGPELPLC